MLTFLQNIVGLTTFGYEHNRNKRFLVFPRGGAFKVPNNIILYLYHLLYTNFAYQIIKFI